MFQKDISTLVKKIKKSGEKFDYLLAISRGGLVPGVVLSHKLNIPYLVPITWSSEEHPKILKCYNAWIPQEISRGKRVLLVDDILDSGLTIASLGEEWIKMCVSNKEVDKNVSVAVLLYNQDLNLMIKPFYGMSFSRRKFRKYINFWWEK